MMNLHQTLEDYLTMRRSLGYKLDRTGKHLSDFVKYLDQTGSSLITIKNAVAWAKLPTNATSRTWAARLSTVRIFAKYVHTFDPRTEIPASEIVAPRKVRSTPYVYSEEDVQALMEAARGLRSSLCASTYTTLFGLLSISGMRVGEAIALDCADVDQREGLLTIRGAKFGKSREIVLHPTTLEALESYAKKRSTTIIHPKSPSFFVNQNGNRLIPQNVHETFLRLIRRAGMEGRKPRRPRIHDLRHSFAIRTLIGWYRVGLDVEAYLPRLSTYLGHVCPSSTYWYLTGVPELLGLAVERLEKAQGEQS